MHLSARSLPPGPKGAPFIGSWRELMRDQFGFLMELGRYGDIAACQICGRTIYLVNHPDYIREVLVDQRAQIVKHPQDLKRMRFLGTGLLTSEGDFHARQRRLMQPAFQYQQVKNYAGIMQDCTLRMMEEWRAGEFRDMAAEMMQVTLAIAGKTFFGVDVGSTQARRVSAALSILQAVAIRPRMLLPLPEWALPLSNLQMRRASQALEEVIMPIISERRASATNTGTTDTGDLLLTLLKAQDENSGIGMTDEEVRDEVVTLFLAGHETTANALTWTWYLLSQHPEAEARLHDELEKVVGGRVPTLDDLPHLAYTEMVVKESLRLYPPAWSLNPRQARRDLKLGEYTIPKNSMILVMPYVIHHNPRFFPEPERFDPERFNAENEKQIPKYAYLPFGAGPRVCMGQTFAMIEARLILATVAQRFQLSRESNQEITLSPQITLSAKHGMRMQINARRISHQTYSQN